MIHQNKEVNHCESVFNRSITKNEAHIRQFPGENNLEVNLIKRCSKFCIVQSYFPEMEKLYNNIRLFFKQNATCGRMLTLKDITLMQSSSSRRTVTLNIELGLYVKVGLGRGSPHLFPVYNL